MSGKILLLAALSFAALCAPAFADPVRVVAAENFYSDVAAQIGGANVAVTSILTNPDVDPHLFEASTETARALTDAKVVVADGAGYDNWMERLMSANKVPGRKDIVVGQLVGRHAGENPHLWLRSGLYEGGGQGHRRRPCRRGPRAQSGLSTGEANFVASLRPLDAKIADMRRRFAGQLVTASEPVFGYQAGLIGLKVHNEKFAWTIMVNAEPTASQLADFEGDLRGHKVKAMLYNAQASEPALQRLVNLARGNSIPIGVSETETPGSTYQAWMYAQLDALDRALSSGAR